MRRPAQEARAAPGCVAAGRPGPRDRDALRGNSPRPGRRRAQEDRGWTSIDRLRSASRNWSSLASRTLPASVRPLQSILPRMKGVSGAGAIVSASGQGEECKSRAAFLRRARCRSQPRRRGTLQPVRSGSKPPRPRVDSRCRAGPALALPGAMVAPNSRRMAWAILGVGGPAFPPASYARQPGDASRSACVARATRPNLPADVVRPSGPG